MGKLEGNKKTTQKQSFLKNKHLNKLEIMCLLKYLMVQQKQQKEVRKICLVAVISAICSGISAIISCIKYLM